ncbi:DUF1998 domain-containing protein [Sphaerisporangium sp. NPDC051011]|uniref:DUF1998 domain-containing protein n=1 Tax=Sphaerisporangium sp. NPDC051011 TaxID=3155792 RepID=UPI003406134E
MTERTRTPQGAVRRTQMITTYGVGSLVAIGDQSFIISGLDTWKADLAPVIHEPNLQHWLSVNEFRLPPAASPPAGDGVRVRLFPEMYSCPECKALQPFSRFGSPRGKSRCGACDRPLTPSRFVTACVNGHLDDFPYWEWLHNKSGDATGDRGERHDLTLHNTGGTASLRSILIKCSCGVRPVSMEGALGGGALESIGFRCKSRRPWLGRDGDDEACSETPRALQRGSSAAWFPVQRSSLSIPPWSQALHKFVVKHLEQLLEHAQNEVALDAVIGAIIKRYPFTKDQVLGVLSEHRQLREENREEETTQLDASSRLRKKEYRELLNGTTEVSRDDDFECESARTDASDPIPPGLGKIMLVKRLREVRVLEAFTRVEMPDPALSASRPAPLSKRAMDWLPAIEVMGEGVFLTIEAGRLREWEDADGPSARANRIRDNHRAVLLRRAQLSQRRHATVDTDSPITPRYILLHTLAHALINEWSLDSGYPAAALRERIYCSDDMAGVLIYTATSDSAGSLGGVVSQGELHKLRNSLRSAMDRISWCSQDPPCMESEASGADSLNLAACYACVLLPEVSCEANNTFLDRAMLVGTPDAPQIGFFH